MSDERLEQWIDAVLDGEADAEEREALERRLRADPEARERLSQRQALFESLRAVPNHEPPPEVLASVMAAVRREPRRAAGWRERLASLLTPRPVRRPRMALAAGFALGSLATLALVALIDRSPRMGAPVSGTMTRPIGHTVDQRRIALSRGWIEAETRRADSEVWVLLRGRFAESARIEIHFDDRELSPVLVVPPTGDGSHMETSAGRTTIVARGEHASRLAWRAEVARPGPMWISLRAGREEAQAELAVTPPAARE